VLGSPSAAETLITPQLSVTIKPTASDTAASVLPLKPYREHPFRWIDVWRSVKSSPWTWFVLVLIAIAGLWLVWRRYFKRAPAVQELPVIVLPAHEQAVRDLIALKDKHYPARGMLREFFTEYSQIMRAYLERRYEFPALEMTTFELERELQSDRFPVSLERMLMPQIHEADLVKFAKYVPSGQLCDSMLEEGFQIVEATRPRESETPEAKAA